jgi:hypothetical protein
MMRRCRLWIVNRDMINDRGLMLVNAAIKKAAAEALAAIEQYDREGFE